MLIDADVRAVESARRTLRANGISNAETMLSDCGSAVFERQYDCVITNPPFHQGVGVDYEVACQFVRDAARVLRSGGRLFLVANRFLSYGTLIAEVFGNVETIYDGGRYHVLTAVARSDGLR
jgi:16S rRNA (guanine1207-N2)-methyltransferase